MFYFYFWNSESSSFSGCQFNRVGPYNTNPHWLWISSYVYEFLVSNWLYNVHCTCNTKISAKFEFANHLVFNWNIQNLWNSTEAKVNNVEPTVRYWIQTHTPSNATILHGLEIEVHKMDTNSNLGQVTKKWSFLFFGKPAIGLIFSLSSRNR